MTRLLYMLAGAAEIYGWCAFLHHTFSGVARVVQTVRGARNLIRRLRGFALATILVVAAFAMLHSRYQPAGFRACMALSAVAGVVFGLLIYQPRGSLPSAH